MSALGKISATLLAASLSLFAGTFTLDKSHSSVGFKVKHLMVSNVTGNFSDYTGSFSIVDGKLTALEGTVLTASINTENDRRDKHLRSPDFFDAAKYPQMTMKLLSVKGDEAVVELTIKDVTKKVTMELEMGGEVDDPWGNHRAGLELTGKIDRTVFGLNWNKLLETGGVVVGDTVKMMIALEGIEQKPK
jgi:polyisoprenoid-binding protein YceI